MLSSQDCFKIYKSWHSAVGKHYSQKPVLSIIHDGTRLLPHTHKDLDDIFFCLYGHATFHTLQSV